MLVATRFSLVRASVLSSLNTLTLLGGCQEGHVAHKNLWHILAKATFCGQYTDDAPLPSNRQLLSYDDCWRLRGRVVRSVPYCVV